MGAFWSPGSLGPQNDQIKDALTVTNKKEEEKEIMPILAPVDAFLRM